MTFLTSPRVSIHQCQKFSSASIFASLVTATAPGSITYRTSTTLNVYLLPHSELEVHDKEDRVRVAAR